MCSRTSKLSLVTAELLSKQIKPINQYALNGHMIDYALNYHWKFEYIDKILTRIKLEKMSKLDVIMSSVLDRAKYKTQLKGIQNEKLYR